MNRTTLFAVLVVAGLSGLGGYLAFFNGARNDSGEFTVPVKIETAEIGGPFELVDHTGKKITDRDFLGRYTLVYFGYIFCPDVCPTSLQHLVDALDLLPQEISDRVTPLFVSVDPDRDQPSQLAEYVELFHPKLVGATGTREQIDAMAKGYRAGYRLNKQSPDDMDYSVDHTSLTYLMGPDGKYIKHFPYGMTGDVMAKRIEQLVK